MRSSVLVLTGFLWLALAAGAQTSKGRTIYFKRFTEPREGAFSILVPKGWQTDGGILRVNPATAGGPANAIEAKLDFTIKRDAQGSVLMRWLPDTRYADMRGMPAAGMFPPGSNYGGMTVMPLMNAAMFLERIAFPYAHRRAAGVRVIERKPLPGLARQVKSGIAWLSISSNFTFDAAMVTFQYTEGGAPYREKMVGVIQNWGQIAAGMWENKETFLVRASPAELDRLAPILAVIRGSARINPQWVIGEIRGQMQRAKIAGDTLRYMQKLDREITEHRQRTNWEINNDMFLTLTGQEDYVNPHSGRVEQGSNQWKHRWVSPSGEEIYTDDPDYNPSLDINLNRSDFKKSPIRPRR